MPYTTLNQVAAMFPTFRRGIPQQNPSDTYIQNYIDDVAGEIDAALQRRFGEAISNTPFATWVSSLTVDAQNLLEKINRYGAAAQLGAVFESLGFGTMGKLAREYEADYKQLLNELNNLDEKGSPRKQEAGLYDHLFDIEAATPGPRPQLGGVAGAEEPRNARDNIGESSIFTKFGERGR